MTLDKNTLDGRFALSGAAASQAPAEEPRPAVPSNR